MQTDYSLVRGFNYQPSYARNGLDSWLDRFNPKTIEVEIGRGKKYFPAINTLRIWLSLDAYIIDPETYIQNVDTMMDIVGSFGLKIIPVIFNGWHSFPDFGGVSFEQIYLGRKMGVFQHCMEDLVGPHADDDRILVWDLCNEPLNNAPGADACKTVVEWLTELYSIAKSLKVSAPVAAAATPTMDCVRALEPVSDILTIHPYYAWNEWVTEKRLFTEFLDDVVEYSKKVDKPLLATETCWGEVDDKKRVENMRFELGELKKRGIGWTVHLMHHSQVADAHRRWTPPNIFAGYMAFINEDGSLREGHEAFNEF